AHGPAHPYRKEESMSTRLTWAGFWRETGRAIGEDYRKKLHSQARQMPLLFGVAWGVKGLTWNLTAKTVAYKGIGRPIYRKVKNVRATRRGEEKPFASLWRSTTKTGKGDKSTTTTTKTKSTTVINGEVIDETVETVEQTTVRIWPTSPTIPAVSSAPATVTPLPIQTGDAMKKGAALLKQSTLGRRYLALAAEYDEFIPVQGSEAESVLDLLHLSDQAWGLIADGIDAWSGTIAACGIDRRVIVPVWEAAEDLAGAAGRFRKARRAVERLYDGQLEQDASSAQTIQTVPIRLVGMADPAGIKPLGIAVAAEYAASTPRIDEEATSILEGLRTSQAALAVCAEAVEQAAGRLRSQAKVARVVTGLVTSAGA